eukprot:gene39865-63646_t
MHVIRSATRGRAASSGTPTAGVFVARPEAMQTLDDLQRSTRSTGLVHLDLDRFHQVNTQW